MKVILRALMALAMLAPFAVRAETPPPAAPGYRPGVSLQPVVIYDANGNIVGSFGGAPAALTAASATIALPQNTATQISPAGLKRFGVQVQGTGRVLVGFDNTVCSSGYRLDGAPSATAQGPIQTWYPANASAYWACAPDAASSVFVERGQ